MLKRQIIRHKRQVLLCKYHAALN